MTFANLPGLANEVGALEIVVPDVLGDGIATADLAVLFREIAEAHPTFLYMGVIQGLDEPERLRSLERMQELGYIDRYALPRVMNNGRDYARAELAARLHHEQPELNFHALGSSGWTEEAKILSGLPNIQSMDTAMPVKLALEGIALTADVRYTVNPHSTQWFVHRAEIPPFYHKRIWKNCHTFLEWAKCDTL